MRRLSAPNACRAVFNFTCSDLIRHPAHDGMTSSASEQFSHGLPTDMLNFKHLAQQLGTDPRSKRKPPIQHQMTISENCYQSNVHQDIAHTVFVSKPPMAQTQPSWKGTNPKHNATTNLTMDVQSPHRRPVRGAIIKQTCLFK